MPSQTEVASEKAKRSRGKGLLRVVRVTVLTLVGCGMFIFFAQNRLLYFPVTEIETIPSDLGLPYTEVTLTTQDGEALSAWFIPAKAPCGTILYCHGNAGNIGACLDAAGVFTGLGFNVLLFDYRGFGASTGRPSEKGTALDAEAAWTYLTQERNIGADRIVLYGWSLGGAVASRLAAEHTPAALVLDSSFTSVPDLGAEIYPWLPVRWLCRFKYNTRENLRHVRCPVLVVHSREDELAGFHHGEDLYRAAPPPKQFLETTGRHNELLTGESLNRYKEGLDRFLAAHIPQAAVRP